VLAWWLVSISNGPEGYDSFMIYAAMPLGLVVLFGFTWSFAFHFCNGIRHLAWDLGYGFDKHGGPTPACWSSRFPSDRHRRLCLGLDRTCGVSAMKSAQTPLHKVQGMGSVPLMLGLAGTNEVTACSFSPIPGTRC
jgi:hypothetical protein